MGYTRLLVATEKTPERTLGVDLSVSAFLASADFRSLICFQTCGVWREASFTYRRASFSGRSFLTSVSWSWPRIGASRAAACSGPSPIFSMSGANIVGSAVMS